MNKIALITPDRGDRPEFLEHCRWQMQRQTLKQFTHFIIGEPGVEGVVDIVPRIKRGIRLAQKAGYDYCFIIENDDYYPDNYLEKMMVNFHYSAGMLGLDDTIYYSLQQKAWMSFTHPGRASLFCTAFRISALDDYKWPDDQMLYLDMHLWSLNCFKTLVKLAHPPIGMKHGSGFCPGNYHNGIVNGKPAKKMYEDSDMSWLRKKIRPESFEFYRKYSNNLK